MHIHILGICGTFMGGLALLARALGHRVTGSDANVYPPMSTQLQDQGIELMEGHDPGHLAPAPDRVLVGNAYSRGNPQIEYLLDRGLAYTSGPQWLAETVLPGRWVLAVSGTHGKTTTSSLLAWVLEQAGLAPGFLIGGVAENFGLSARLGDSPFFVIEADEYDTAFFDKRSKFVHYRPRTLIINNLEFDHADIFDDLTAIQRQFHHLVRTVPGQGRLIVPREDPAVEAVLVQGCWTPREPFGEGPGAGWGVSALSPDYSRLGFSLDGRVAAQGQWELLGRHNALNAAAALAAARHVGVTPAQACAALPGFRSVKRRMEVIGRLRGITVYDDFAHHPTAIRTTVEGLRRRVGQERILAVLEPRSNTMRMGVHRQDLATALAAADEVLVFKPPDLGWDLEAVLAPLGPRSRVSDDIGAMVEGLRQGARTGDHILIMSNGGFGGLHRRLLAALEEQP